MNAIDRAIRLVENHQYDSIIRESLLVMLKAIKDESEKETLSHHATTEGEEGLREAVIKHNNCGYPNKCDECGITTRKSCWLLRVLSAPTKATEPLAVLADRKGWVFDDVVISIWERKSQGAKDKEFSTHTYESAEQLARQYLEGLPDVKGGE